MRRKSGWDLETAVGERWRRRRGQGEESGQPMMMVERRNRQGERLGHLTNSLLGAPECTSGLISRCGSEGNKRAHQIKAILLTGGASTTAYFVCIKFGSRLQVNKTGISFLTKPATARTSPVTFPGLILKQ